MFLTLHGQTSQEFQPLKTGFIQRKQDFNAAWGELSPSLAINGIFYSRYSELGVNPLDPTSPYTFSEQMIDNNYKRASIDVRIPIFAQFTNRNRINQAKIQVLDSRLALNQEFKDLREEIQRASMEAQNAQAKLIASDEAVKSAEEDYNMVVEQFQAGLVTSVDVKISSSQFVQAKANQTQARYELLLRSKILDFYQGKEIRL